VEPGYRNKYPPLGLMKISTYHKMRGDYVQYVKGYDQNIREEIWDRIYITTLFTFYWKNTIDTINYYKKSTNSLNNIFVGGIAATLLKNDVIKETGVNVVSGLLDKPGILDIGDRYIIDNLIPDYKILEDSTYEYGVRDAYIGYATRGCPRKCDFCAVNKIEPEYIHYLPLKKQIKGIEEVYGQKQDLILMDNNVLASDKFDKIIKDILDLGFYKGAKLNNKKRCLDFNQGTDARYITKNKMKLIAKTAIHPLRIAFDFIGMKDIYISKIKLARDCGILDLSNYVLYNYYDKPEEFYERLKINILLNKKYGTKIYSFPMKYVPLDGKDRSAATYVGKHWNRQLLRGINCILLATRGMVSPKLDFFEAAFGKNIDEFLKIAMMPEEYIINRRKHENNGAYDWGKLYNKLSEIQINQFKEIVSNKKVLESDIKISTSIKMKKFLSHYIEAERIYQIRRAKKRELVQYIKDNQQVI